MRSHCHITITSVAWTFKKHPVYFSDLPLPHPVLRMKRTRKDVEMADAPESSATMPQFNPADMSLYMSNSAMASQVQPPFIPSSSQLPTTIANHAQLTLPTQRQLAMSNRGQLAMPSQDQLSTSTANQVQLSTTSMPNQRQLPMSMANQGALSMPSQGLLSTSMQNQLPMTSGLQQVPESGDNPFPFSKRQRLDVEDFHNDHVADILNFDSMQQEKMFTNFLEKNVTTGMDIYSPALGIPSSSSGYSDRCRTMPVRPMVRIGTSSRDPDILTDDLNLGQFAPFDLENKEGTRHMLSMSDSLPIATDPNLALMTPNQYHDMDRRRASTSNDGLNQSNTPATVTRPQNLAEIKPERQSPLVGVAPLTTTPSASTSGNHGPVSPDDAGHSNVSSPSSSREDGHASGVSSTNGASSPKDGKGIKRSHSVPDDEKDESYWQKRRKNNESAKRSREARRTKELQINYQVLFLERENLALKTEVDMVQRDCDQMEAQLHDIRNRRLGVGRYGRGPLMGQEQGSSRHDYDYPAVPPAHQGPPPPPPPPGPMHM